MTTAAPWGRASIHPEGPEEPQIRLESGGEAERSPSLLSPDGMGCDDGHALAGVILGVISNGEKSVITMVFLWIRNYGPYIQPKPKVKKNFIINRIQHQLKQPKKFRMPRGSAPIGAERRRWPCQGRSEDWGDLALVRTQ